MNTSSENLESSVKVLQPKAGVRATCVCVYIAGIVVWALFVPEKFRILVIGINAAIGALWLVDIFTTRIELRSDGILICSLFRTRVYPRADIENVNWEKGAGASIKLRDGKWVRLPNTGHSPQGQTNTIRAWIRKA